MVACCMCCVFDSRPAETFVKFCPAKPGVVWSILSLENFNFCNAGDCQCFVFMYLLHPNPTPNSICLEPSCCHVNQTSSPCHWTCRHRCGQFHSRRPGCGNILARFFEIVSGASGFLKLFVVQMVNGHRREQNKSNCGWKLNWPVSTVIYNDIYRDYSYIHCTFVHVPSACPFPPVCGSEEMSSQLSKVLCQISRGMARHCSPAAPAALTFLTMSTMRRIQVVAEVAEVATWFWPIFRSWRHLGVVCTLPLKKVASPSHRYRRCWILSSPWSTWSGHAVGLKPSVMNVAGL